MKRLKNIITKDREKKLKILQLLDDVKMGIEIRMCIIIKFIDWEEKEIFKKMKAITE